MPEIDWREQYEELERNLGYIFSGFQQTLERDNLPTAIADVELTEVRVSTNNKEADVVAIHSGPPASFAFYLYFNDERVAVIKYGPKNNAVFPLLGPGRYRVRAFAKPQSNTAATPVERADRFEVN